MSIIFRPDADPETTSIDGQVYIWTNNQTWANLRAGILFEGYGALDVEDTWALNGILITGGNDNDTWSELYRGVILFDTSSLPNDIIISSATLSLKGEAKQDHLGILPNINIYSVDPASNTSLTGDDFNTFGTIAYCDTPISYASWSASEWNTFTLNSEGLSAISKTGITKIGVRNVNYDVDNVAPAWSSGNPESGLYFASADDSVDTAPRLTITYPTSSMTGGNLAVVETRIQYVDAYSSERYWLGIEIGASDQAPGNITVVENRVHYVDTLQKERYIKGIPV